MLLVLHAAAAHAREAHEAPWVVDAPALPPSAVNGLTIDSGGFLWVSDDRSLARFDGKERLALPARRERNSSYVYQIVSLQNGSVYAVPGGSSVLCGHAEDLDDCLAASPGDTGLLKAEHPQGPGPIIATLPGPRIYSASPSRAGGLWLGSTGRVVRMRSDETLSPFAGEVAGTVTALVERSSGGLVIGTSKGLFELAAESAPHGARLLVDVPVHALAADHEQNIWVAGPLGLLQLAPSGARTRIAGLPSEDVRALVVDHEGDVWAGTWDGVVRVVRGKVVPLFF